MFPKKNYTDRYLNRGYRVFSTRDGSLVRNLNDEKKWKIPASIRLFVFQYHVIRLQLVETEGNK